MYLNSAAEKKFGVTQAWFDKLPDSAKKQSDFANGHYWEQGWFALLPLTAAAIASPERLRTGLEFVKAYYHANGVTLGAEPGGILVKKAQDAQNAVLSDSSSPFRFYFIAGLSEAARQQSNLEEGHFWEGGMFGVMPKLLPAIATPDRLRRGLEFVVGYYHANGVTLGCEPGGLFSKPLQDAQNAVLSRPDSPFRFLFIPDGKSIVAAFPDTAVSETEKVLGWGEGMTAMVPRAIKLFADGAIYSLAMQLRDPYIGEGHGEWIMQPDVFARAFRIYWDAGYQIHVHVNGDAGLDMVLDNVEANMRRRPRHDHRTLAIHLAVSRKDQVDRMKRLGVIVSANPYYVRALSDAYAQKGLGPERADNMVRLGDIERAGVSYSLHSDMPMAPGQPLFLMHCAVNRTTVSGRVAAPDQRASRLGALKGVTLSAAHSLRMENDMGSIVPGKLANFTILEDNPLTVDAAKIKDIPVWGTVFEGKVLPVARS
jgi:predicted amidohydrolase YtcJ